MKLGLQEENHIREYTVGRVENTRDAQERTRVVVALRLQVEVVPTSNPLKVANVVVIQRIDVWLV